MTRLSEIRARLDAATRAEQDPLPIGTRVKPWGRIEAIACLEGERYYFLTNGALTVSMMPADVIERAAKESPDA